MSDTPSTAVVYVPTGFSGFEAVAPYEVLSLIPGWEVVFASRSGGQVASDTGALVIQTVPLASVEHARVLYVPGGAIHLEIEDADLLAELRRINDTTEYTSWACVGGTLLGAAGLMRGVKVADDNGVPMPDFGQIKVPGRVVADGKYISAGNTASAIDLALLIAAQYVDEEDARAIQVGMEYDLDIFGPPFTPRATQRVTDDERSRFMSLVMRGSRGRIVEGLTA